MNLRVSLKFKFTLLIVGIMLEAASPACAGTITCDDNNVRIQTRSFAMILAGDSEGVRIKSIARCNDKGELIASQPSCKALWKLTMKKDGVERIVGPAQFKTVRTMENSADGKTLTIAWNPIFLDKGNVQITVRIHVRDDEDFIRMRIKVQNNSDRTLSKVIFPYVSGVGPLGANPESDVLVWPGLYGCGTLVHNPYQNDIIKHHPEWFPYPAAFQAMQFTCVYTQPKGNGLYFAAYDPKCYIKSFWYEPEPSGMSLAYFIENLPEQMNVPGNDYDMPYDAVIGTFNGDWWDAAGIYRDWALKQDWCRQMNVMQDPSVPQAVKDAAMWVHLSGYPQPVLEDALKYKQFFGVKFVLHYYQWHQIPFDSFYPEYFPPKEGFENTVERLQKENIPVMPYINVRLWSIDAKSYRKENASKASVWDEAGKVVIENYGRPFAAMLPCSRLWQDKIVSICDTLALKYNVEGIYLDQLSAVGAIPSFNMLEKTAGGGNYWAAGYWKMLDSIHSTLKAKPIFVTSESFTESYISRMNGGFLVWVAYGQDDIPLAQAVYGGRTNFWGRAFAEKDLEGDAYYTKLADMLTKGIQIGWLFDWLLKDNAKEQRDFTIRMAKMYDCALRKPFLDGHMIRPPLVHGMTGDITSNWASRGSTIPITRPAVMTAAWQCRDGEKTVLLINSSSLPQTVSIDGTFFDSPDKLKIWYTHDMQWRDWTNRATTIPPRQAIVIACP